MTLGSNTTQPGEGFVLLNAKKRTLALITLAGAFLFVLAGVAQAKPAGTISPQEGLTNGTVVTITGTGFTAGKTLGITECSDQGDSTGAGDCDLGKIKTVTVGADGKVSGTYTVSAGPFGQNNRVCDATHKCVISLGEETADPNAERVVFNVSFTGGSSTAAAPTAAAAPLARTGAQAVGLLLFAGLGMLLLGSATRVVVRPATRRH